VVLANAPHAERANTDQTIRKRTITMNIRPMALCCALAAAAAPAWASDFNSRPILPLALASEATMTAVATCEKNGYAVTATIVDANGQVRSVAKADLAGPHTVDSSRQKAYTAVSLGPTFDVATTGEVAAKAQASPTGPALAAVPGFLLFAGGIVIKSGDIILGGIGVGGAGNGDKDQICARAALDRIADRLK
jgi:uncharacterized protein GlcG (DUF336 family)